MARIHPTAIVESSARLADSVSVGPYCVVGPDVELGEGVSLISHVVVTGRTTVGAGTRIFPFASIGHQPQDLKYKGEPSTLVIGSNNTIREHVTMNPGTEGGGMVTRIGDNGLFMVGVHIGHDCQVGSNVILANNATLGGHVVLGDHAVLGGLCAVHQFVRIGRHAMVGGMSGVEFDVIPFGTVTGNRAALSGLNIIGMKRRGYSTEDINALRAAYRELFQGEGVFAERLAAVAGKYQNSPAVAEVIEFVRAESSRGLCQPAKAGDAA